MSLLGTPVLAKASQHSRSHMSFLSSFYGHPKSHAWAAIAKFPKIGWLKQKKCIYLTSGAEKSKTEILRKVVFILKPLLGLYL